jgi:hypothetical protein
MGRTDGKDLNNLVRDLWNKEILGVQLVRKAALKQIMFIKWNKN